MAFTGRLGIVVALGMALSGCLPEDLAGSSRHDEPAAKSAISDDSAEPECVMLWDEATRSHQLDCPDPTPPPLLLD